ncbi:hypothetical protein AVEN_263387-1 [Araneus ventricosus]|uniref:Uncharacterized protein n=1 Tax=Araneus ventricosus TaxID=182803 RepID=A0A4Y2VQG4_ARAVE|nr:hypothetical protein AVEN_263387-1 [Araneus ventricosus]
MLKGKGALMSFLGKTNLGMLKKEDRYICLAERKIDVLNLEEENFSHLMKTSHVREQGSSKKKQRSKRNFKLQTDMINKDLVEPLLQ